MNENDIILFALSKYYLCCESLLLLFCAIGKLFPKIKWVIFKLKTF